MKFTIQRSIQLLVTITLLTVATATTIEQQAKELEECLGQESYKYNITVQSNALLVSKVIGYAIVLNDTDRLLQECVDKHVTENYAISGVYDYVGQYEENLAEGITPVGPGGVSSENVTENERQLERRSDFELVGHKGTRCTGTILWAYDLVLDICTHCEYFLHSLKYLQ